MESEDEIETINSTSSEGEDDEQHDNDHNHHFGDEPQFLDGIPDDEIENEAQRRPRKRNRKKIEFKWGKRKKDL